MGGASSVAKTVSFEIHSTKLEDVVKTLEIEEALCLFDDMLDAEPNPSNCKCQSHLSGQQDESGRRHFAKYLRVQHLERRLQSHESS